MSAQTRARISAALKGRHRGGTHPKTHGHTARGASRVGKPHPHAGHGKGTHTTRTPKTARRKGVVHPRVPKTSRRKGVHTTHPGHAPRKPRVAGHGSLQHAARQGRLVSHPHRVIHGAIQQHKRKHYRKRKHHPVRHRLPGTSMHRHFNHAHSLISAHRRRNLKGLLHTKTRHHLHQPKIRRKPLAHRVWRRR